MKGSELGDWGRRRRSWDRRRTGRSWVWAAATLTVLAGSAMLVVWQKVRFEGVLIEHSRLVEAHARLATDYGAERTRFERQATRATLIPRAIELGLVQPQTRDIALVSFGDQTPQGGPPLIDALIEPASAASNPNQRGTNGR